MQSPSMHVDTAVGLLKKTEISAITGHQVLWLHKCQPKTCNEKNVEAVLQQKKLRSTKRHFFYESFDEPFNDALKNLEVEFCCCCFECCCWCCNISTLREIFHIGKCAREVWHFVKFPKSLTWGAGRTLWGSSLHFKGHLDGKMLVQELKNLPVLPKNTMSQSEMLNFIHERELTQIYTNLWTALWIALTLLRQRGASQSWSSSNLTWGHQCHRNTVLLLQSSVLTTSLLSRFHMMM